MIKLLWIVGLSFALFVFGAWTILIVIAGITHRHLNQKGLVMLFTDAYIVWITFSYLRQKVSESAKPQTKPLDSN